MRLGFVGDLMLVGSLSRRLANGWDPFEKCAKLLKTFDSAVGNLEGPLTSVHSPTKLKSAEDVKAKKQYILRGPPIGLRRLAEANIRMLTLGNNHSMDHGWKGLNDCLATMQRLNLRGSGASQTISKARQGTVIDGEVAILSYLAYRSWPAIQACGPASDSKPGIAYMPPLTPKGVNPKALQWLKEDIESAGTERVIVAFHWGDEGATKPHPYQTQLAKAAIDRGAVAVIGHHPHVLQPTERYKGRLIAYSLGNFVAARCHGALGDTAILALEFQDNGAIRALWHPARIVGGTPEPQGKAVVI